MNIFAHFLLIWSYIAFILQETLLQNCIQQMHSGSTHYQKVLGLVPTGDLLSNKDNEIPVAGDCSGCCWYFEKIIKAFRFICCDCAIVQMLCCMGSSTKMWTLIKRFPVDTKSYFAGKTWVGKAQLGGTELKWSQLALIAKNQHSSSLLVSHDRLPKGLLSYILLVWRVFCLISEFSNSTS